MSAPRIVIICQARLGSTRLPKKVLLPLAGQPLLIRFLERVSRARLAHKVVVATTTEPADDQLCQLSSEAGYDVYRGHPHDLLDRHLKTAQAFGADVIVKIPSDCPLIDPTVIDTVIASYLAHHGAVDYVSNLHPGSWPDGNDVEVMSVKILERAWYAARKPYEREHTTPWMWDGNAGVRTENVVWGHGPDLSMSHRWTIDYPEDYMLIKAVYDNLYCRSTQFSTMDIISFLNEHPEIAGVNAHLAGVNWYRDHLAELRTISAHNTRDYPSSSLQV